MDSRVEEFRKLASAFGIGKGRRFSPYPERCRNLALDYAEERLEKGASAQSISETLGISAQTLSDWRERYGGEVRAVRVSEEVAEKEAEEEAPPEVRSSAVVVLPSGARIEGLDIDGVIAVLKAVG